MTEPARMPIDSDAREAIYHRLDQTLFVTAGAGSGKTHALVKRIAGLVRSGVPLKRIAAITFTNSAAAELRDRVRAELESLADSPERLSPAEVEYVEDALSTIDAGAIQTLHSFAQRLVSLFPLESGLPPEIEVRDEVAASIAFEDRWQPFTEQLMEDGLGDPEVAAALLHGTNSGLTALHLRNIAVALNKEWDRVLEIEFPCPPMPALDPSDIIAAMEEAASLVDQVMPGREAEDRAYGPLTAFIKPLDGLRSSWQMLQSASTPTERLAIEERIFWLLRSDMYPVRGNMGRAPNWRPGALARVRKSTGEATAARDELLGGIRAACLGPILRAIQQFVREYRDERLSLGSLEFYDVLVLARDLLSSNAEVRGRLHARYEAILIDEFQDTDPLQVELAVLLATEPRTPGAMPWDEAPIPPGRLFFDRDPTQSNYRVRRADIDLYTNAARRFGQQPLGETVLLTQNFRSAPSLIAWVNQVFGELFTLDRASGEVAQEASQVAFDALTAWREESVPGGVAVRLLGGPVPKSVGGNKYDQTDLVRLRQAEATDMTALIDGIREDSSAWQVVDGSETRDARLADIAILLPTRVALPAIEKALNERGIPCRVESRSLLFETQEVRDLLIILAAIDDPTDQVAVVSALRSPGFGCSDADIYRFAAAGGSWNYLRELPLEYPANDLVSLGVAALRDLHARRWWLSIGEMVDAVIRERRLLQVAFTARRPRETWQRLRFVHDQARAFTSAGGRSLRQFVRFMERQAEEQSRVNERAVSEDDDDAVRIMTIHASKGLEFPIVILAGLNSKPQSISPVLLTTPNGGAEIRVGNRFTSFETAGYQSLAARETLMERIEDDRVLYVGATRARDHLVVSLYHLRTAEPKGRVEPHLDRHVRGTCSAAECIYEIAHERPDLWRAAEVAVTEPAPTKPSLVTRVDTAADYADWRTTRADLIASQSRAPVIAATALAKAGRLLATIDSDEKAEQSDESAPWKKGRASTSLGRAVHAVLQTIDLATGEGTAEASRAQAIAEGLPARDAEIASLVDAARRSQAVQTAIASGRFWREVYVATEIDGVTVEGFIDLLYEGPDGLVVVDYKTDSARDAAAIDASMARYRMQGAAYSLALQESIGRPVAACTFVFIRPAEERNIADLAAAMAEVRTLIPLVASGSSATGVEDEPEPEPEPEAPHADSPPPEPPAAPSEPPVEVVAPKKGKQLAFDLGA